RDQSRFLQLECVCECDLSWGSLRRSPVVGAVPQNLQPRATTTDTIVFRTRALDLYIPFNIATRAACRPPSNSVSNQTCTISSARFSSISRSPRESTLASLCWRESRALSKFQHSAQRTPCTLFATIASPLPEPPKTIPRSH